MASDSIVRQIQDTHLGDYPGLEDGNYLFIENA